MTILDKRIIFIVIIGGIVAGSIGFSQIEMNKPDAGIIIDEQDAEPAVTGGESEASGLPETVNVGVLLPATGDIASHGEDNIIATQLGADDFNAYLSDNGEPWQMNLIHEDTQTDPIVALEKIQSLNSKGIKFILGTETSAELLNVKSYADSNDMLMISPSSTSPKLAIPDNIFRLIPDDTKQGKVLAELLTADGIKVVVPIYRGDVWGDGLFQSTQDSYVQLGGAFDEGIRYNPEITVFSTEASLLADSVERYIEEYSAEEVAVLMIGFSEVVHFMNSANSYDVLHSVRWYGSDGSANDDAITEDRISSEFATDVTFVAAQFSAAKNEKYERVRDHLIETIGSAPNSYAYSSYDSVWLLGLTMLEKQTLDHQIIADGLSETAESYTGAIGSIKFNDAGDLEIADYELFTVSDGEWIGYGHYDSSSNSITLS